MFEIIYKSFIVKKLDIYQTYHRTQGQKKSIELCSVNFSRNKSLLDLKFIS